MKIPKTNREKTELCPLQTILIGISLVVRRR
jgi:hypothetical protein